MPACYATFLLFVRHLYMDLNNGNVDSLSSAQRNTLLASVTTLPSTLKKQQHQRQMTKDKCYGRCPSK